MMITPMFAAVLGLLFVYLSIGVIKIRIGKSVSSGSGEIADLDRAIRAHGNFSEYVPLTLILLWFVETLTMSRLLVLLVGSVFVIGRVMHVIGMVQPKRWMILRQLGTVFTLSTMLVLSLYLIYWYFPVSL